MRDDTIKRLREILPPLLTLPQYCRLRSCCQAPAYNDLKNKPGIAVKVGGNLLPSPEEPKVVPLLGAA
jgi:hypothetical protein